MYAIHYIPFTYRWYRQKISSYWYSRNWPITPILIHRYTSYLVKEWTNLTSDWLPCWPALSGNNLLLSQCWKETAPSPTSGRIHPEASPWTLSPTTNLTHAPKGHFITEYDVLGHTRSWHCWPVYTTWGWEASVQHVMHTGDKDQWCLYGGCMVHWKQSTKDTYRKGSIIINFLGNVNFLPCYWTYIESHINDKLYNTNKIISIATVLSNHITHRSYFFFKYSTK